MKILSTGKLKPKTMRRLIAQELNTHRNEYLKHPHLLSWCEKYGVDIKTLHMKFVSKNAEAAADPIVRELQLSYQDKQHACILHAIALATVTGKRVYSWYPEVITN